MSTLVNLTRYPSLKSLGMSSRQMSHKHKGIFDFDFRGCEDIADSDIKFVRRMIDSTLDHCNDNVTFFEDGFDYMDWPEDASEEIMYFLNGCSGKFDTYCCTVVCTDDIITRLICHREPKPREGDGMFMSAVMVTFMKGMPACCQLKNYFVDPEDSSSYKYNMFYTQTMQDAPTSGDYMIGKCLIESSIERMFDKILTLICHKFSGILDYVDIPHGEDAGTPLLNKCGFPIRYVRSLDKSCIREDRVSSAYILKGCVCKYMVFVNHVNKTVSPSGKIYDEDYGLEKIFTRLPETHRLYEKYKALCKEHGGDIGYLGVMTVPVYERKSEHGKDCLELHNVYVLRTKDRSDTVIGRTLFESDSSHALALFANVHEEHIERASH